MCYNNNVIKRGNPKTERKGSKMRKVRALTPSQVARQIFRIYDYSVETRGHIENVITSYSQMSHPHAKGMAHYSKIKGIC